MAGLPEIPRFEAEDSDPGKAKYGPIAYGLKVLVDGLAVSTGLSGAQVVGGLLTVLALGFALVVAAGVVLMKETVGGGPGHPLFDTRDQAAAQPAAPDLPSPLPVGSLGAQPQGNLTPIYGGGGGAPETVPVAHIPPPQAADQTATRTAGAERKPWPKQRPWNVKGAAYQRFQSGLEPNNPDSQARFGAPPVGGGGAGQGRFTSKMAQAAGGYAGEIGGAPELPAGQVLGAQGGEGGPGGGAAYGLKGGKVAGPVLQDKIPDVGPGKQITQNPTPGAPTHGVESSNVPGGRTAGGADDVNKIELDPSKANDIDRAPGVGQSMDNLGIGK